MSESLIKRLVGAGVGVLCALMILFIGFWRTILIALLAGLGWWVAGSRKIPEKLVEWTAQITARLFGGRGD